MAQALRLDEIEDFFPKQFNLNNIKSWLQPTQVQSAKQKEILKYTDFTLYKAKDDGITFGGFFYDKNNVNWLLKEGHYNNPVSIVKEYVAGGIYQLILGDNAPRTEIVLNDTESTLLIGSKLLDNFKTLSKYDNYSHYNQETGYYQPYGAAFPNTLNGKPIHGFMDAIWAINFVKDTDAHSGNVGLIDHGDHYNFAKIDHGFSFNYYYNTDTSLDDIRNHLSSFYQIESLEKVGFDEIYQGLSHITDLDFTNIEALVKEKMDNVKTYMDVLNLKDLNASYHAYQGACSLDENIQGYQDYLVSKLRAEHNQFKTIADTMSLEKAILDHDSAKVVALTEKGVSLESSFKPFFNPMYQNDTYYYNKQTHSVTGLDLGQKYWPEVFKPETVDLLKSHVITIADVLNTNTNTTALDMPVDNIVALPIIQPLPLIQPFVECA